MPTASLTINNISKSYDDKQILDKLSMQINMGEIFGLIGLNGIGKTTLIKCILQLTHADSGTATIFDIDASKDKSRHNLALRVGRNISFLQARKWE